MFTDCATGKNLNLSVTLQAEMLYVSINIHTNTNHYILRKETITQTFKLTTNCTYIHAV
jgi:hypothetical protein